MTELAATRSGATSDSGASPGGFEVHLGVFEGPFDLLLGLISKHQLDVTEVALSQVTDEFIGYIRVRGESFDLDQATHFLVVAATLLDLKAARLLPTAEVEDEEDLALLEARDLLFARLLQYRAYRDVAQELAARMAEAGRRHPRSVPPDPLLAGLLPEVLVGIGADALGRLASRVLAPKPVPTVSLSHIHAPRISVRDQAAVLVTRLRRQRTATFRSLVADAGDTVVVVARFLALLELFREGAVAFEQMEPLAELQVRWTGSEEGELDVHDEFDEPDEGAAADVAPGREVDLGRNAVGVRTGSDTERAPDPAPASPPIPAPDTTGDPAP